jgi:hypothetical protein
MAGSFALDISKFVNKTHSNVDLVTKKVIINLMRSVVRKSPVGNPEIWVTMHNGQYVDYESVHGISSHVGGRFKANWQYDSNSMPSGTLDAIDADGGSTLTRIIGEIPAQASGKIHYIVNNLPYSIRLENGWSSQAPSGMVGLTISEYQGIVRHAAQEVNP